VRADDQVVDKPSIKVDEDVALTVDRGPRFVSRGGEKLQAAFDAFNMDVTGLICADLGASTGGFTDCLLQYGAAKVYAIDVGQGILHWKLRNDPRVVVMEGTNARYLEKLPEPVEFVTVDASFISLKNLLPVVKGWGLKQLLILIKPQFEAGRKEVARGKGVVRDAKIHRRVLLDVLDFAIDNSYQVNGLARSPVLGPKGNVEFLGWLGISSSDGFADFSLDKLVSTVI
jgi:23S rRNA (cytidine1920-2'-O)/16S rRNA (cytidine1409-2'-O)-methyltransferase